MSLDVSLYNETKIVCECGRKHTTGRELVYDANITHNLTTVAIEAGIYRPVWRPEECGIATACQLIEPLERGITLLEADPVRFSTYDSPNGWGTYGSFVPWLRRYLAACREHPDAKVEVSR